MKRLGLALFLASCGFTDPDTFYSFRGTVHAAQAEASRGAPVTLFVERRPQRWNECSGEAVRTALTDTDGGYAFEALAAELFDPALGAREACIRFETTFDGGAKAFADLDFLSQTKFVLPRLDEWNPSASVDGGVLTFRPFGRRELGLGWWPTSGHRAVLKAGGAVGWVAADTGFFDGGAPDVGTFRFDSDELEDFTFTVDLEAFRIEEVADPGALSVPSSPTTLRRTRARFGTDLELRGTVVPVSRGAACAGLGSPCPLTDGRLEAVELDPPLNAITFEFSRPITPRRVLLRGLNSGWNRRMPVTVNGTATLEPRDPQENWSVASPRTSDARGEPLFESYEPRLQAATSTITLSFATPVQSLAEVSFFE